MEKEEVELRSMKHELYRKERINKETRKESGIIKCFKS